MQGKVASDILREKIASCIPKLRSVARGLTGQPATADDLVQLTLVRALKRLDQVYDASRIESWLYTILHSQWVDEIRKEDRQKNKLVKFSVVQEIQRATPRAAERNMCTALDLEKAMGRLQPGQREVLSLVHIAGYNYAEVATLLGIPVGTVASRVARARERLSSLLRDEVYDRRQKKIGGGKHGSSS